MTSLILPPSSNWFQHNAISSRDEDRSLVIASFRNIVVYKIPETKGSLKLSQFIAYGYGKVNGVSLYPNCSNDNYGSSFAAFGDQGIVSLYNIDSGGLIAMHNIQNTSKGNVNINSLSWARVKNDDVVVVVGDKGYMLQWQPMSSVVKSFNLEVKKKLSVVEVLPHAKDEALVAADKFVLHVSLLDGSILNQFKGHDNSIYCIKIFPGLKKPQSFMPHDTNVNWRKTDDDVQEVSETAMGVVFATSDFSRNILVWDLSMKRYVTQAVAPLSSSNSKKGFRDRNQGRNLHVSLCWAQDILYSSTIAGEIVEWNIHKGSPNMKSRLVTHCHSAVIYNMESLGRLLLTFSNDRNMHCYDLVSNSTFYDMPTIGVCTCSMAFSPHDANRLALGMQTGGLKLLTFGGNSGIKVQNIGYNIKEKILSLSWHPSEEGRLLYGTTEGQIGFFDVVTGALSKFAYHHQKAAYKVEWGFAVAPEKTGLDEDIWYAYSFGDRELIAHNPRNLMQDPKILNDFMEYENSSNPGFGFSEFAFSPDYRFLITGHLNGELRVFDRMTLSCRFIISRVRKVIQHLLWKPPTADGISYIFGVASGENSIFIFDLDSEIEENDEKLREPKMITQPKMELCAHTSRSIWLSWSPHIDGYLASSSYDNTVQIWNANTGEPIGNYGGHQHRVFRAEFSPLDADKLISFAEENSIHEWNISKLTAKTPAQSATILKGMRKKNQIVSVDQENQSSMDKRSVSPIHENEQSIKAVFDAKEASAKRSSSRKSSFPLFHGVSSRKKSFHHMCILSLMESKLAEKKQVEKDLDQDDCLSEELEGENSSHSNSADKAEICDERELKVHVSKSLEKYRDFVPEDQLLPEADDVCFYLDFFGSLPQVDDVVRKEIKNHDTNENLSRSNVMHCWQGSLESRIKWAANNKCLDSFLVSAAPQVSFSLWQFACEAYAEQLAEAQDPVTAATYLVSIHKDEEAVHLLMKHKHFREALVIAKYKLGFNQEIINSVINNWISTCLFEGNIELSALLHIQLGDIENAARSLARRSEPRSLIVAAQLYLVAERHQLAHSTAVLAFQVASTKNEFVKFEPIIKRIPSLHWCKCINICHEIVLERIDMLKKTLVENDTTYDAPPLHIAVINKWEEFGITPDGYAKYSRDIKENLTTQKLPVSVKQLWFLVSVSVSEMILDTKGQWQQSLESALDCLQFWEKMDQMFYFTHLLLPKGIDDFSFPVDKDLKYSVLMRLYELYVKSEAKTILSLLETDKNYLPFNVQYRKDEGYILSNGNCNAKDGRVIKVTSGSHPQLNGVDGTHQNGYSENNGNAVDGISGVPSENGHEDNPKDTLIGSQTFKIFTDEDSFCRAFQSYLTKEIKNKEIFGILSQMLNLIHQNEGISTELFNKLSSELSTMN